MDLLLLFFLASVAGAGAVAAVIIWSTQRAASSAITSYFKAGEYILATGQPPPDWLKHGQRRRWFRQPSAQSDLLARLDDLLRFFEGCRFFEDEWTREQMLSQLAAIRKTWQENSPAQSQGNS